MRTKLIIALLLISLLAAFLPVAVEASVSVAALPGRVDTGVDPYINARYYDPELGRFISADTLVQDPANPQSLNRYSYVLNNPLKYIDPSGHFLWVPFLIAAAFITFDAYNYYQNPSVENAAWLGFDLFGGALIGKAGEVVWWGEEFLRTIHASEEGAVRLGRGVEGAVAASNRLSTGADEAVFWSGVRRGDAAAAEWAGRNGGSTLETTLTARGIKLPAWDASNSASVTAWRQASKDFAVGARGNVRVLQTDAVRINSTWMEVEWPALKANPNITSIRAVNPETGKETLLWSR